MTDLHEKEMKTYNASLVNDQGCCFDSCTDTCIKRIKAWARGRGGEYRLVINPCFGDAMQFNVKNNRVYNNVVGYGYD